MKCRERQVFEFSDRYSATGRARPDPKTMCKGRCEGMGFYPDMPNSKHLAAADVPFVRCERCNGTGKEPT